MPVYCEGKTCSKRDTCKFHNPTDNRKLYQYLDWSTQGSGCMNAVNVTIIDYSCGDRGNYRLYRPMTKLPMKTVIHINEHIYIEKSYESFKCSHCNSTCDITNINNDIIILTCPACSRESSIDRNNLIK